MTIPFLMAFLFGSGAFLWGLEWKGMLTLAIVGMFLGVGLSIYIEEKIIRNCLTGEQVVVVETFDLLPFSNKDDKDVYIVTGEDQYGKKVAWYLQKNELIIEEYDKIVFIETNATMPAKQLVKVDVGSFWRWFDITPDRYRFVVPVGGVQEGKVVKTYKFLPKS